ncbi:MAG TPA: ribosomal protein S18-alanine N-acetyltransferase [Oligoflexia bacterium]|nr:ribosomal protein S18-alanine N-acetyltransferase [Oligoflexia bacterium]HMR24367.1 ribosomal protein S18-alanine N-acetyltransferase [Oligoflexia bacterium]
MQESVVHVQFKKQQVDAIKKNILQLLKESGFLKNSQDQNLIEQKHVHCFSIVNQQQALAYVVISILDDEAEIFYIYVLPKNRQQGYGQRVLQKACDYCKTLKVKKIFLELRQSNDKAYKLYLKNGFVDLLCRKNYYADGEDARVMQRYL